jgi:hypothetical protein
MEKQVGGEYMASIKEKYRGNDKQYSLSIIHNLINTKHHYSKSVHEHIIYLCDLGAKLNSLKMGFDDPLMVHLALVSLSDEYGNLVSSYNNMKEKWTIDKLISHDVLEEERLKKSNKDRINNVGNERKFHAKGTTIMLRRISLKATIPSMRRVSHLARLNLRRMVKFITSVVTTVTTRMIVLSGLLEKVKIILVLLMDPFMLIFH